MLLVFGAITMDVTFDLPHLPGAGDTMWSGASRMAPGGKAASQAIAARRDGAAVTLVAAVGQDALADAALAGLALEGVDLHVVRLAGAETGRSAIGVDPEGYTIVMTDAAANLRLCESQVPDSMLSRETILLVQMETGPQATAALIHRARARGARIVLNLSPARPIDAAALRAVDVLIGNSAEFAWAGEHLGTGNNPASLHGALGVACVRMMGAQGAEAFFDGCWRHVPALPVAMRDTTGAGDCFVGVFAAALSRGADMAGALRRAGVAAALSTRKLGGAQVFPQAAAIDSAMQDAPTVTSTQEEVPD